MRGSRLAKFTRTTAIWMVVVSVVGFIVALVLNAFFLDRYDAYGEVPIPGSATLQLPAGEITVNLHTVVMNGTSGGLPVPPLGVTITPPDGVAQPTLTEDIGSSTTVNNDAHVRVWVARIPVAGAYNITTDGQVSGYIMPRLAFGRKNAYGFVPWVFAATFVAGLAGWILAGRWLARTRRAALAAQPNVVAPEPAASPQPVVAPEHAVSPEPTDQGVRLEQLKTLTSLRDSGALTEQEFETEKRRILKGY